MLSVIKGDYILHTLCMIILSLYIVYVIYHDKGPTVTHRESSNIDGRRGRHKNRAYISHVMHDNFQF